MDTDEKRKQEDQHLLDLINHTVGLKGTVVQMTRPSTREIMPYIHQLFRLYSGSASMIDENNKAGRLIWATMHWLEWCIDRIEKMKKEESRNMDPDEQKKQQLHTERLIKAARDRELRWRKKYEVLAAQFGLEDNGLREQAQQPIT